MNRPDELLAQLLSRPRPTGFPDHVVLPDYDGLSIARIADVVLSALGVSVRPGRLVEAVAPCRVDRVLLVILDGLGYRGLTELASEEARADFDAIASRGTCIPLTTVFPSTTVAALTTYSTGLPPAGHGMLGYRLYLREISSIVNMIQLTVVGGRGESPLPESFAADALLTHPTVYERLAESGVDSHVVLPRGIAASGLSRLLYRGATHVHPAIEFSDMLALSRQILNAARARTVVTLYWPGLDTIGHVRGCESDAYVAEAASIASALRRELVGRAERTLLLLSSDHGFASMTPADYLPTTRFPDLHDRSLLFPVGEPRASYMFFGAGRGSSRLTYPAPVLEDDLLFLDADVALSLGLFGSSPIHPETRHRLGDLLVVSTGRRGLRHPYPDAALLRGMHGGLTADEMIVPLLVGPL
jgi:hypothetical protein